MNHLVLYRELTHYTAASMTFSYAVHDFHGYMCMNSVYLPLCIVVGFTLIIIFTLLLLRLFIVINKIKTIFTVTKHSINNDVTIFVKKYKNTITVNFYNSTNASQERNYCGCSAVLNFNPTSQ